MITDAKKGTCGSCGCDQFQIFTDKKEGSINKIFVECAKCKEVSIITLTLPTLTVEFSENGKGRLAF